MTRIVHRTLIAALSAMVLGGASTSAHAATCKIVYGVATHADLAIATSRARQNLQARLQRFGRGRVVSSHVSPRRVRRSPPLWAVYAGARFCMIQRQGAPRRVRRPIQPRPFR